MNPKLRYLIRNVAYGTPILGQMMRRAVEKTTITPLHSTQEYWDNSLSTFASAYLGGTIQVDSRNAHSVILIKHLAPNARSILDIGCASGSLVSSLDKRYARYLGVDISQVAISQARKSIANCTDSPTKIDFIKSDLQTFQTSEQFDIIFFNEVLYYLKLERIEPEIKRYWDFLSPEGLMIISMKEDVLSRQIYKLICRDHDWVYGIIIQEQPMFPSYKIRFNRQHPAFLHGVFRPKPKENL